MGHILKIGRYEVVDAELDAQNLTSVSIPCQTNPGLCYQLDGWDPHTSVPAFIDGNAVELTVDRYDSSADRWLLSRHA